MKKSILLFSFLLVTTASLFAQDYYSEDFVGTWKYAKTTIKLDSDKSAKVYWKDGTSSYGTWTLYSFLDNSLNISLNDSNLKFEIEKKTNSSMTVWDKNARKRYTFSKNISNSSTNVTEAAAVTATVVLGTALLWYLLDGGDSGGSDYSPCSTCGGKGFVSSGNCPSGCPCPGCGG